VSWEEAQQLVSKALEQGDATKLPGFALQQEPDDTYYPGFYNFSALWNNPGGNNVIGFYAVDRATGDVWSADECKQFNSAPLKKLQKAIRWRLEMDDKLYRKLKRPGPMCSRGEPRSKNSPRR